MHECFGAERLDRMDDDLGRQLVGVIAHELKSSRALLMTVHPAIAVTFRHQPQQTFVAPSRKHSVAVFGTDVGQFLPLCRVRSETHELEAPDEISVSLQPFHSFRRAWVFRISKVGEHHRICHLVA
jgi:hypothetical protein